MKYEPARTLKTLDDTPITQNWNLICDQLTRIGI